MKDKAQERGEPLDEETAAKVRHLAEHYGTYAASRMLGIGHEGMARAAARLPVYATTRRKIAAYFAKGAGR